MDKQERFYFDIWIALLSMLSGMVNVLTLLLFLIPATHFTGNITQFVLALNEGEWSVVIRLLGMILCFGGGGVLSGGGYFLRKNLNLLNDTAFYY